MTGGTSFLDDLAPVGTLQLAFARSTHAHAELIGVDLADAARSPGVAGAFAANDLSLPALVPELSGPGARRIEGWPGDRPDRRGGPGSRRHSTGDRGALLEAIRYGADGQPLTASFMDYLVPGPCELPALVVEHLETPAPDLRAGHMGVGVGGTLARGPALANAVANALGVELDALPIEPGFVAAAAARVPIT